MKGRIDSIPSLSTHPSLDPLLLEHVSSPAKSTKLYAAGRWVSRQWKETTREVLADLRDGRSWRPFLVLLFLSWIGFLLFAITTLGASSYGYSLQGALNTACKPDDSFTPFANDYSPWGSSGFFQITLAFGPLDFTPAKVIDICWDVVSHECNFHLVHLKITRLLLARRPRRTGGTGYAVMACLLALCHDLNGPLSGHVPNILGRLSSSGTYVLLHMASPTGFHFLPASEFHRRDGVYDHDHDLRAGVSDAC